MLSSLITLIALLQTQRSGMFFIFGLLLGSRTTKRTLEPVEQLESELKRVLRLLLREQYHVVWSLLMN